MESLTVTKIIHAIALSVHGPRPNIEDEIGGAVFPTSGGSVCYATANKFC
jgi:hypothetical protein